MNEDMDFQKEIDSLSKMIKDPVDRHTLEEELNTYLNKYLMDLESSKRAIVKEHGGTDDDYVPPMAEHCRISEIVDGAKRTLIARVDSHRLNTTKTGKTILKIDVSDDSGSVLINIWNTEPMVRKGTVYTFRNCRIKYNGYVDSLEATCDASDVEENSEVTIGPSYGKVLSMSIGEKDMRDGLKNVVVHGRVISIRPPSGNPNGPRMTGTFNIGGKDYRFVTWAELPLREHTTVCIDNVSVSFNSHIDQLELKFFKNSTVYEEE